MVTEFLGARRRRAAAFIPHSAHAALFSKHQQGDTFISKLKVTPSAETAEQWVPFHVGRADSSVGACTHQNSPTCVLYIHAAYFILIVYKSASWNETKAPHKMEGTKHGELTPSFRETPEASGLRTALSRVSISYFSPCFTYLHSPHWCLVSSINLFIIFMVFRSMLLLQYKLAKRKIAFRFMYNPL